MDDRMREVYNYLSDKNYPPSYSKLQKLTLRRYASKFSIQNGELYYSAKRTARKVVMTRERGREVFQEFHCSPMGGHSGVFKTRNALSSRFYWPGMMIDILKWFAEQYLTSGSIDQVETSPASIRAQRLEIAGLLMENQGNMDEYCIICSMMDLQSANTTINMVQCDHCNRWAHTECTPYSAEELSHDFSFMCKKCKVNG